MGSVLSQLTGQAKGYACPYLASFSNEFSALVNPVNNMPGQAS